MKTQSQTGGKTLQNTYLTKDLDPKHTKTLKRQQQKNTTVTQKDGETSIFIAAT